MMQSNQRMEMLMEMLTELSLGSLSDEWMEMRLENLTEIPNELGWVC
jgi:hypothetical protein